MLSAHIRRIDETMLCIYLCGDIDLASEESFGAVLRNAIANGATHIVLNVRHVGYMDSCGFGVLIGARRQLTRLGRIALVGANKRVQRLFNVTGLHKMFDLFELESEAIEHLQARRNPQYAAS
jgi:anti-sigma B factor antagonist